MYANESKSNVGIENEPERYSLKSGYQRSLKDFWEHAGNIYILAESQAPFFSTTKCAFY